MSSDADERLRRQAQKAYEAYMKAHLEYERVRRAVIFDNCSEELNLLLANLKESRDQCYAEHQRLKALLDDPSQRRSEQ
jgi:hypothetical protein